MRWPPYFLGYGAHISDHMYGLWEPVLDRFLLVAPDDRMLSQLSILASRRYRTSVIRLDSRRSDPNLIDNSVCLNWTLKDSSAIWVSELNAGVNTDTGLCEASPCDWPVDREQAYPMACYHILRSQTPGQSMFPQYFSYWRAYYDLVKVAIDDPVLFGQDWTELIEFEKLSRRIIFHSRDLDQLSANWKALLAQFHMVQEWNKWVEDQHA